MIKLLVVNNSKYYNSAVRGCYKGDNIMRLWGVDYEIVMNRDIVEGENDKNPI